MVQAYHQFGQTLEREQEREGKIEKMMGTRGTSPKTATDNTTTTSMAEKAGNTVSAGDNRAYSDERS